MAIEIVSFPIKNGGSFHSYVNVYQRDVQGFFFCDDGLNPPIDIFCVRSWDL